MTSAFTVAQKGSVAAFEVSDQLISILGRSVEKHRKGSLFDYTLNTLVNTNDEYIRREHQYRPDVGPKRLTFQALVSAASVMVSPKVGVVEAEQEPYFVLESGLLGEKIMVRLSEGLDRLNAQVQRLLPLSEDRFAAENKGELKSELSLEIVAPRVSVHLKPSKPHRVDREKLAASGKNFVNALATGFRLSGKLVRGAPPTDENGSPATEPEKKKKKKPAVVPEISSLTWDFKQTGGDAIDQLANRSMTDIFAAVAEWVKRSNDDLTKFQILWIRSLTPEAFLANLPAVQEYPEKYHVARCTLTSELASPHISDKIIGSFAKLNEAATLTAFNYDFVSRARGVALIRAAQAAGEPLTATLSAGSGDFALLGLRGFAAGLTCRKGHVAVASLVADERSRKRCDRCLGESASLAYVCQVCDERGLVCGSCGLGGLGFCPQRHALTVVSSKDAAFVPCERCGERGRATALLCPVGNHFHRELCAPCTAEHFFPAMRRCLEPSPFEHCLVVTARVRVKHRNEAETRAFAESRMREILAEPKVTLSPIYGSSEQSEFRFVLERSVDGGSPYKRVIDLMLVCEETGEAQVDIVELDCVPVKNPDEPADDSNLNFWMRRLAMIN